MMNASAADQTKRRIRERVWAALEREHAAPPGVSGHIPDFAGAGAAAERLTTLLAWQRARVIETVPDRAQLPVRQRALHAGKLLYMAVPMLAHELPFYALDPTKLTVPVNQAATKETAEKVAHRVSLDEMRAVDLAVCGSVAVNHDGARLGKGSGYSDIEMALLQEAGLIQQHTTIVTTVHDLQVVNEPIPEAEHDFGVDVIVTPHEVIWCNSPKRPARIYWDNLSTAQIDRIPVLKNRRP
jgi:5-formyltetrahydrofolate cyclo-ligase